MWFAIYCLAVTTSSGVVGVFVQRILAREGYAPGFQLGVTLALGFAAGFMAIQLLYRTGVQLLKPTRARSFYVCETLSQACVVILLPHMLGVTIPWPATILETLEPLIYLGMFCVAHVFFKFMSFFGALQGERGNWFTAGGWAGGAVVLGTVSMTLISGWVEDVRNAIPDVPGDATARRVGEAYRLARPMPEGAVFRCELADYPGQTLTFAWAVPPDLDPTIPAPERVYVTMYFYGEETKRVSQSVRISKTGWAELRVSADALPAQVKSCNVSWGRDKEPPWQRFISFRPVVTSPQTLLMEGPLYHEARGVETPMNVVIVAVEGLGANRVSFLGSRRRTTPSLDSLANVALTFPNTYTPSPEGAAAHASIATGLAPLKHGALGVAARSLRDDVATLAGSLRASHYATAAFVEDADSIFVHGAGFERGFELYDVGEDGGGSTTAETLSRARKWIERNIERKFFAYVRLTELRTIAMQDRYRPGFMPRTGEPDFDDVYDSAVLYVDRQIGELVRWLRDHDTRRNTCIVIVGTHGRETDEHGVVPAALNESTLRVPLVMFIPGRVKEPRPDLIGLEDIAPTLMALVKLPPDATLEGKDFLSGPTGREPLAVLSDPFTLSIRTEKWRCVWAVPEPGALPDVTTASTGSVTSAGLKLYDASRFGKDRVLRDVASRNAAVARVFQERLQAYAQLYVDAGLAASVHP